jgi:hypothetical protein
MGTHTKSFSRSSLSSYSASISCYEEAHDDIITAIVQALPASNFAAHAALEGVGLTDLVTCINRNVKYSLSQDFSNYKPNISSSEEIEMIQELQPLLRILPDEQLNILLTHPATIIRKIAMQQKKERKCFAN